MRVIVVDGDTIALERTLSDLRRACFTAKAVGFSDADDALRYLRQSSADVAVLETCINGTDGFSLISRMRAISPELAVIYLTQSSEQAINAFAVRASDYLLKPASVSEMKRALDRARRMRRVGIEG